MSDLKGLISEYAKAAGLDLSDRQAELCRIHIEIMLEWNRRMNLTRITGIHDAIVKHLLDSLLPASGLPRSGPCLDVGTGAGFPGIPLKIFSPDLDLVLLDSSRKKVSFLIAASAKLGLKGIRAIHGRWEDFVSAAQNLSAFKMITMRAVRIEERHLSMLASRALFTGGVFAWWAGPKSEKTASELSPDSLSDLRARGPFSYSLPGISKPRSVLSWEKS